LKNRVNVYDPTEDSQFNEVNKLISRDGSRTTLNAEDKIYHKIITNILKNDNNNDKDNDKDKDMDFNMNTDKI